MKKEFFVILAQLKKVQESKENTNSINNNHYENN